MATSQAVQVVFLSEPRIGERASIIVNGQPATTSKIVNVQTDPSYPGWHWIDTQSGSRYTGQISSPDKTAYGIQPNTSNNQPSQDVFASLVPPNTRVDDDIARGLNWGAFAFTPMWSIFHNVWIGLLSLIPAVNLFMSIVMLFRGNEWAWKCRKFKDVNEFRAVQAAWNMWAMIVGGVVIFVFVMTFVVGVIWPMMTHVKPVNTTPDFGI